MLRRLRQPPTVVIRHADSYKLRCDPTDILSPMTPPTPSALSLCLLGVLAACTHQPAPELASAAPPPPALDTAAERAAILATLAAETRHFCARDLEAWSRQWAHAPDAEKMYAGEHLGYEYLVGWPAIRAFTAEHIGDNPDPLPLPTTNPDYTVRLLDGNVADVRFTKVVDGETVRETRLLTRAAPDSSWRILRMATLYAPAD